MSLVINDPRKTFSSLPFIPFGFDITISWRMDTPALIRRRPMMKFSMLHPLLLLPPCRFPSSFPLTSCKSVGAQVVMYKEVLPELLGVQNAPRMNVRPALRPLSQRRGILKEFAAAAFRTLHSLPTCTIPSITAAGQLTNLTFGQSITGIESRFSTGGFDDIVRGMMEIPAARNDRFVISPLRNLNIPGIIQRDLVALDAARHSDVGGGSPAAMRHVLNLPPILGWEDLTEEAEVRSNLQLLYGTNYSAVPAFVAMMVEKDIADSQLGALATKVIEQQYSDLREMDPCHYEHIYSGPLLDALEAVTFADVLRVTTGVQVGHHPLHLRTASPPAAGPAPPPLPPPPPRGGGGG